MLEVAEVFQRYGAQYRARYGQGMLPSHQRAMADIERCRTEALGGHVYHCDQCDQPCYSYHSCQNRHCPKCQQQAGQDWLERQQGLLLPVPYPSAALRTGFMVTFTLPEPLKRLARSNQQCVYNLLFRSSAAALQELAQDPRFVGGQVGLVGVLPILRLRSGQAWARDMTYHPHVHFLAPGGGLSDDGQHWLPARNGFLVHVKPLSRLFRGNPSAALRTGFQAALKKTTLYEQVPAAVWQQDWVVDCRPVGSGQAALKYLAPYIFRVAISNNRILKIEQGQVTFRYTDGQSGRQKQCTVPAEEFIRRFLQHVLPKGFVKVRYYGLFSPSHRPRLRQARRLLDADEPAPAAETEAQAPARPAVPEEPTLACPHCGQPMRWVKSVPRQAVRPP